MKTSETIEYIVDWIKDYKKTNRIDGFVIGVSGGIDSALTSTLCALTGFKTLCLNMDQLCALPVWQQTKALTRNQALQVEVASIQDDGDY